MHAASDAAYLVQLYSIHYILERSISLGSRLRVRDGTYPRQMVFKTINLSMTYSGIRYTIYCIQNSIGSRFRAPDGPYDYHMHNAYYSTSTHLLKYNDKNIDCNNAI